MISPGSKNRATSLRNEFLYPFIVTIALSFLVPTLALAAAQHPVLKENVVVEGTLVTLADLFKHAGLKGHTPVFRSPDPGTTGKISVMRILSAAKKHGLKVSSHPRFQAVKISRSSRVIEISELEDLIRGRLEGKLPVVEGKGQLVIKLPDHLKQLHIDPQIHGELSLSSLDWSSRSGRFTARFALAGNDPIIIKGSANMMIEVGVAKADIARGTTLSRSDIEMKFVSSSRALSRQFKNVEDMLGLSAKRRLRAGKAIVLGDLEQPKLIHKNQLVTILLEVPGLVLRTEGKALADATKGETVRVLNTQSKRVIHATAVASGLVSVSLGRSSGSGS